MSHVHTYFTCGCLNRVIQHSNVSNVLLMPIQDRSIILSCHAMTKVSRIARTRTRAATMPRGRVVSENV